MKVEEEELWIELWNQLHELEAAGFVLVNADSQTPCSLEEAKAIVQNAIYQGKSVILKQSWHAGSKAALISILAVCHKSD
jgi:hypothetical protein